MNLEECYSRAGADYADVMRRFMSEERIDKFLRMFLRDENFENLCEAMRTGSYEEAFRAVHTMKGICMNLSLTALLDSCVALTENLRAGKPDEKTVQYFTRAKEEYCRTTAAIRDHLN